MTADVSLPPTRYALAANESPYPPLPGVLAAVAAEAGRLNRYPDPYAAALCGALAQRLGVPAPHVVCGAGSVGVLGQLVAATCGPGSDVVYPWRSFEAYPLLVGLAGATGVPVPLDAEARLDLPAMAAAVTDRTRLVVICNPNNPTGAAVRHGELRRLLDAVPTDVVVLLDEAYREFVSDPGVPDGLDHYRERPNVAVLRTFSKAYGLAGLRVGYAVGQAPLVRAVRAAGPPFTVSGIAEAAALASLRLSGELDRRVQEMLVERDRVRAALLEQGWQVPGSQANFLWVAAPDATARLADVCERAGVGVRMFPGEGVRITIGEPAANDVLLAVTGGAARDAAVGAAAPHRMRTTPHPRRPT